MPAQLMLLPGLMCDSRMFTAQQAAFPDAICIDGFGVTDNFRQMAQTALAAAPDRISLLGHSMGARVALEMVRMAPARIERLALVSTGVHPVQPGEREKRMELVSLGRNEGVDALIDRWLPPMLAPAHLDRADLMDRLRTMCRDVGVDAFAAQIDALLGRPDVESLLPAIACPTLVAAGSADQWSPPAQHAAFAEAIPGAHLHIIDGAGHMLPAEAPDAFNATIAAWLSLPSQPKSDPTGEKND